MMTCEESRRMLSLYLDRELTRNESAAMDEHLEVCPVCRMSLEETRSIIRGLSMVERPAPPTDLVSSINRALLVERAARRAQPPLGFSERFARWVGPHVMPYTVGAFYSVLLFFAVFGAVRHQMQALREMAEAERLQADIPYKVTWVDGVFSVTRVASPEAYAASRSPFAVDSPTLNPQGALAALAWSPSSGDLPDDDDMIVVADVYGNGSASLAAVVEPPRNRQMLSQLEVAFRKNPAFVPASLDHRPQTMRVVFVLQKMNVQDSVY
jgi:hypothetical protein